MIRCFASLLYSVPKQEQIGRAAAALQPHCLGRKPLFIKFTLHRRRRSKLKPEPSYRSLSGGDYALLL